MDIKVLLFQMIALVATVAIPAFATKAYDALQKFWTWLDDLGPMAKRIGASVLAFALVTAFNAVGAVLPPEIAADITKLTSEDIVTFGMALLAFIFKSQDEAKALKARMQ